MLHRWSWCERDANVDAVLLLRVVMVRVEVLDMYGCVSGGCAKLRQILVQQPVASAIEVGIGAVIMQYGVVATNNDAALQW
mgnify:CR=1 FL=1